MLPADGFTPPVLIIHYPDSDSNLFLQIFTKRLRPRHFKTSAADQDVDRPVANGSVGDLFEATSDVFGS